MFQYALALSAAVSFYALFRMTDCCVSTHLSQPVQSRVIAQKLVAAADCCVIGPAAAAVVWLDTGVPSMNALFGSSARAELVTCVYCGFMLYDTYVRVTHADLFDAAYLVHHAFAFSIYMTCVAMRSMSRARLYTLMFTFADGLTALKHVLRHVGGHRAKPFIRVLYYAEFVWFNVRVVFAYAILYKLMRLHFNNDELSRGTTWGLALCFFCFNLLLTYWSYAKFKNYFGRRARLKMK